MNKPAQPTIRQRQFVSEYLKCGDASAAHRLVYGGRYNSNARAVQAHRLLRHPLVAPLVAEAEGKAKAAMEKVVDQYALSKERVLQELAMIGLSNMGDYMKSDDDGYPLANFSDLTRAQTAAMSEVQVTSYVEGKGPDRREVKKVRFKLHDKRQALVNIAQIEGWLVERREAKDTLDIQVKYTPVERQKRIEALLAKMRVASVVDHDVGAASPPVIGHMPAPDDRDGRD